ncbi:aquaporin family protein [Streptococcaceae bacterium ESL0687]|nr:aquaporin family protein [Streptococcaceae bacterium ESL0687]
MTEVLGEFVGTFFLVLLGDGVCAAVNLKKSKAEGAGWLAIAFGWSMAVTMAAFMSGYLGPAHLNPAVTIAMAINGATPVSQVLPFILAQLAGAFLGVILVWLAYLPHWDQTKDQDAILGSFATGPAVRNYTANFVTEAIGTFVLLFGILSFGRQDFAGGVNTFAVGGLILALGLSLGGPTGYALNPARDLGPRLAHQVLPIRTKGDSDWAYSWVPIFGPIVGASLAALIFGLLP